MPPNKFTIKMIKKFLYKEAYMDLIEAHVKALEMAIGIQSGDKKDVEKILETAEKFKAFIYEKPQNK